jgi:hypothetical protein
MNETHVLGEVFKDSWDSSYPWRVQMPNGRMPFRTRKEALRVSEVILKAKQREEEKS